MFFFIIIIIIGNFLDLCNYAANLSEHISIFGCATIQAIWVWRRPLVKMMCRITKTQLEVQGISEHYPWKSQPWPADFTFASRGQDGWSRLPLSKGGQLIKQGTLLCRDDLKFWLAYCPKCLSQQSLLTDRRTVQGTKYLFGGNFMKPGTQSGTYARLMDMIS